MRDAAQTAGAPPIRARNAHQEYGFLVGPLVDAATLGAVEAEALACGVAVHQVLLAWSLVSNDDYAAALAYRLGVPLVGWETGLEAIAVHKGSAATAELWARRPGGRPLRVLGATEAPPDALLAHVAMLREQGIEPALTSQPRAEAAIAQQDEALLLDRAAGGLLEERPKSSAASPAATWQLLAATVCAGLAIGGLAVVPDVTCAAATALIGLPFLCVGLLRAVALRQAFAGPAREPRQGRQPPARCPDALLPFYSVLVPLFREANMLPGLVRSLAALDYPAAKLEVILVLEAIDLETQAALLDMGLPGNFRTLVVPDRQPRTKPKALNYALQCARGDFIVVYDAEDRPQRDQLRRAWEVFRLAPPGLGCLQAQLNIYNPWDGWFFTRQFTIEYSALFDAILPALERLRLPVPLGGTSNHFPHATLVEVGAWDPHNVTEDADLGIRLARQGYRTAVLASTTWEEAPPRFGIWLRQRTRWMKGWMHPYPTSYISYISMGYIEIFAVV